MAALVLSGGGVFGAALLGALHSLHSLDPFKVFAGTSVGALICALLVIGYTPLELLRLVSDEPSLMKPEHKLDFNRFGMVSQDNIRAFMERLFEEKTKAKSFQEIYKEFKKELIIVGTNLSRQHAVYFQKEDFPQMNVIDALMISCCVPMVFPYIVFENEVHVDGFVTDNFPIRYVAEKYSDVIGINICKNQKFIVNFHNVNTYVGSLFKTFLGSKEYSSCCSSCYEIEVDPDMNQLHASPNDLVRLFNEGFQQMTEKKNKKANQENENKTVSAK